MPVLPTFDAPLAPEPAQQPRLNPAVAGLPQAAAAQGLDRVSDTAFDFAQRYADARRQADAATAIAGASQKLNDLQFQYSKVPDRAAATAGFQKAAGYAVDASGNFQITPGGVLQQTLDGISDPLVKAHVQDRLMLEAIASNSEVQQNSFGLESSKRRGDLDAELFQLAQRASAAGTPQLRAIVTDNANAAIQGAVAGGWLHPEEGQQHQLAFAANVDRADALKYIRDASAAADAGRLSPLDIASYISDPSHFPHLPPQEREQLSQDAVRTGRTIIAMRTANDAHNDVIAERAQKATQATTAAALIASVTSAAPGGAPVDPGKLADLVRTQQISEAGFSAVLAAQARREAGKDDPAIALDLWRRANGGEDVSHDALEDYSAGKLSRNTLLEVGKAVDARAKGQESQVDKANFATLKSALNGYAVEQNPGVFPEEERAQKAQLWTEAQGEWTQRVIAGHESSGAVLADMLQRYVKHPDAPEGLPQPRLGAVNSLQDVAAVWTRTKAAHGARQMDDATFQSETALLAKYQRAFLAAQQQAAAAKAASKGNGGARSQPAGPSADE